MQFSLSDTAGQKVDAETGLPVKDNTIFWKNLWNIIKWVGIILAVVVVLFFLLVVSVRVRHFLYRKKRKNRRVKYPVTAGTQITQRQGQSIFMYSRIRWTDGPAPNVRCPVRGKAGDSQNRMEL